MTPPADPPRRRLNPFAFPSETDFRFALLIVLIISVCLANFYTLFLTTPSSFQRTYFATLEDCLRRFPPNLAVDLETPSDLEGLVEQFDGRNQPTQACYQPIANRLILRIFAATSAVLIVAGLIFQFAPRWTIRRHHLSPLTAGDLPEVDDYLARLCAEMELRRRPSFLWNPLNATRSAFTFGNLSTQYVAMNMGLVSQVFTDREAFRAVLLHELAHLKNADLSKTQFANAIWIAYLIMAALPGVFLSLIVDVPLTGFGLIGWSRLWQLVLLTGLVYFTRNGILRAKEYYADVRASTYLTSPDALHQILAAGPAPTRAGLRRWFATHPPPGRRIDVLYDTRPLFFTTLEMAAIPGVVIGMIYATNELWATSLGQRYFGQNAVLSLLLSILLLGTIGLSVWRATTAGLLRPPARQKLGRIALGMGLGLFFGAQVIDMAGTLDFLGTADMAHIAGLQIILVVWALFGAAITYAVGLWSVTCATAWSEYAAGRQSPRSVYIGWFLIGSAITAILIYPLTITFAMGQTLILGVVFILSALVIMLSSIPAYLLTSLSGSVLFIGIWALPLAAWLFHRRFRPIHEAAWAYLEPSAAESGATNPQPVAEARAERPAFGIGTAVSGALVATAVFLLLLAIKWIVRFGRGVVPGPEVQYNDGFGTATIAGTVVLVVLLVVWVGARTIRFQFSHALFASFLLGVFISLANNMVNGTIETGNPFANLGYYWADMQLVWGAGLLVSLPAVMVGRWLRGAARRS